MKRILLTGGFGNHDNGDEAQLTAVLANIRKLIPEAHLTLLSDDIENTWSYHHEETFWAANHYIRRNLFLRRQAKTQTRQKTEKPANTKRNTSGLKHALVGFIFGVQ